MGSMLDERCPWDSGSEEDEDEDWLYSSVSRYQHLLMCRHVPLLFLVLVLVSALVRGVWVLVVLVFRSGLGGPGGGLCPGPGLGPAWSWSLFSKFDLSG